MAVRSIVAAALILLLAVSPVSAHGNASKCRPDTSLGFLALIGTHLSGTPAVWGEIVDASGAAVYYFGADAFVYDKPGEYLADISIADRSVWYGLTVDAHFYQPPAMPFTGPVVASCSWVLS